MSKKITFTPEQVADILLRYRANECQWKIAELYGVDRTVIGYILSENMPADERKEITRTNHSEAYLKLHQDSQFIQKCRESHNTPEVLEKCSKAGMRSLEKLNF